MCGILGYIGEGLKIKDLLDGLKRLEYRGYDSCGIAVRLDKEKIYLDKDKGKIDSLEEKISLYKERITTQGIFHTRWATHGEPNRVNAHPHYDCLKQIFIVHNGIIENFSNLKKRLSSSHKFLSETDTEVIVHLLEENYQKTKDYFKTIQHTVKILEGAYSLLIIFKDNPNHIFGIRKGSPLVVGKNSQGTFLASDIPALIPFVQEVVYLKEEEIVVVSPSHIQITDFMGKSFPLSWEKIKLKKEDIGKEGYEHFMLKEIYEQPQISARILQMYFKDNTIVFPNINISPNFLKKIRKIFITGCGTAYHAGYASKYFGERILDLPIEIDVSSEMRYRKIQFHSHDILIAISQSGETADTLATVRKAKTQGVKVLAICNVLGSSLIKEADGYIFTPAGPEIGVASTKAYTAQLLVLFLFCLYLAKLQNKIKDIEIESIKGELLEIPKYQKQLLAKSGYIKKLANIFSQYGCYLFLGRGIDYPSALEGALKLKEISYIPAEGYPAGEMKHGPIALIDEYRVVVCILLKDNLYQKMLSNIQEIHARKGKILIITNTDDDWLKQITKYIIKIPHLKNSQLNPLLVALPLQLFAYYVAKNLHCEIDQPRNLAKSVTVE